MSSSNPEKADSAPRDFEFMCRAVQRASHARWLAPPNPWVGAVLVAKDGCTFEAATQPAGGSHAEFQVIESAGSKSEGGVLYTTLEPCSHQGKTPACTKAIVESGVERVVVGIADPDPLVNGSGIAYLQEAGIEVQVGVGAEIVEDQLKPYLKHRCERKPYVILKLALTLDGFIASPDGSSQWITGAEARRDSHRLRAESDAVLVGSSTIAADDPSLTVRDFSPGVDSGFCQPKRVVLGSAPATARAQPLTEVAGEVSQVLDILAGQGVLQLLVEGGADVAAQFHSQGLVDEYVFYLAPAFMGGSQGLKPFSGEGALTIDQLKRGRIEEVVRLGGDLRVNIKGVG